MVSPAKFLKEVGLELQRVVWPAPKTVAQHTGIVVVSMIVTILVVGAVDAGLVSLVSKFLLKG